MLSVIVPAYNEEKTILRILGVVFEVKPEKEVIAINDGSSDNTGFILAKLDEKFKSGEISFPNLTNFKFINKELNEGKGSAIREGYKAANGEIVVVQDADLEVDPKDYKILLEPFESGKADIVFGSRFLKVENHKKFERSSYYANLFLTKFSNMFTGVTMTDMETCYKVFRRETVSKFDLKSNRFGIEPELAAYAAKEVKNGQTFYEVPISYYPRKHHDGKKITWWDGVKAIFGIIRYNLLF